MSTRKRKPSSCRFRPTPPPTRSASDTDYGYRGDPKYASIFRALQEQRANLLREAEALLDQRHEVVSYPDMSDQAWAEADQAITWRIKDREHNLIKKIDEALERLSAGTYGICDVCGEEIPLKRLEARPVTTLCIECKTRQEQKEHPH